MGDIQSGINWVDGQSVDAAGLNNMMNNATVEPGLIIDKSSSIPIGTDQLLYYQGGSDSLKRAAISQLVPVGIPGASTVGPNLFNAGPATGSPHVPTFRAIATRDIAIPTVDLAAGTVIDWAAGNTFKKTLTANTTFTFTNLIDGQIIWIALIQGGAGSFVPTMPAVSWENTAIPTWSTAVGKTDLVKCIRIGSKVYAWATLNHP